MNKVLIDFNKEMGAVKALHGVNNAPMRPWDDGQPEFKAAGIPYCRTHDTAGMWGGGHYVDIPNIFPNFDADENDPASYDFAFTDAYLKAIYESGAEPYYRLGVTIENWFRIKAYNIAPPKDFEKWARICEHVVRHYNEGWADGFEWNLTYWEIWNEPENPPMWSGTREEYFELYRVASNHLKKLFPNIKVGGFASCGFYAVDDAGASDFYKSFVTWFEEFLKYIKAPETAAPLDFFSWHIYLSGNWGPERIMTHAKYAREKLDAAGFTNVESHLNEWNDVSRGFDIMKEAPCATTVAAAICLMQNGPVDKALYYDALPTRGYCGLFYFPSQKTTPTYEAFCAFNVLYRLGTSVECKVEGEKLYGLAAKKDDRMAVMLVNRNDEAREVEVAAMGSDTTFAVRLMDGEHSVLTEMGEWKAGDKITLPPYSITLLSNEAYVAERKSGGVKTVGNGIDG